MKNITRREFSLLAVAGTAAATPLTGRLAPTLPATQERSAEAKPKARVALTTEQAKKVEQEIAKREEQVAAMRDRTLPYALEPAFTFHAQATPNLPVRIQRKG
jgi:hypothetical protein